MLGLFNSLDHSDPLFKKFLSRWYPENDRPKATRQTMFILPGYDGEPMNLDTMQSLDEKTLLETKLQIQDVANQALTDYQNIIKSSRLDLTVVDAVDKYYDRKKVVRLLKESDPKDINNVYLKTVCQFGAMLGYLLSQNDEFGWIYAQPYFHSIVVHKKAGYAVPVFDWAVKKFSSDGIDEGFAAKYIAMVKTIQRQYLVSL
jgi:hypothetical protein